MAKNQTKAKPRKNEERQPKHATRPRSGKRMSAENRAIKHTIEALTAINPLRKIDAQTRKAVKNLCAAWSTWNYAPK